MKRTAAKTTRILYSEKRNALAPEAIFSEISLIFSFPASCLLMKRAVYNAKPTATNPEMIARMNGAIRKTP